MTLENEEAVSRINDLANRIPQPQLCYTHEWHAGDLLRWDHCRVPHLATFDYQWPQHRRRVQRITADGSVPFSGALP